MKFLTEEECAQWCQEKSVPLIPEGLIIEDPNLMALTYRFPKEAHRYFSFASALASFLSPFDYCLLWVTNHLVFPSSSNLHLYYRLRQSYGDLRLIEDAPGHLFLGHEEHDLTTFLQLGMLYGWDLSALPFPATNGYAYCSHDEFIRLNCSTEPEAFEDFGGV